MTAHILQHVPMERKLDMNVETWSDSFGTLLNDIGNGGKFIKMSLVYQICVNIFITVFVYIYIC